MKSSVETLEGNKVKVYVEVDETEFETDIDKAFRTIAREVKLPGFRQGKVPRRVLEARIGLAAARDQALRDGIPNYLSRAVRENNVDIVATPGVEITGGEESGPVEFEAEIEIRPVVEIPGYRDLSVELPAIDPTEEETEEAVKVELSQHGEPVDVDRPAELGDTLTIDLATTRDGEEVAGLNTDDWSYELGQGWVTEDFDDRLVGASIGDVIEFTSTPKQTEESADFKVTIKAIQTIEMPELTDEWVAENIVEFETVAEWTESIVSELVEGRLAATRQEVGSKGIAALTELVDIDPPESMVQSEMRQQIQSLGRQLQSNGIDLQQWLEMTGQTAEQMLEGARPHAEEAVKADLALRAVAVAEGLAANDADLEREFAQMALSYQQKASDIRKIYEENDAVAELRADIGKRKAMDWLIHNIAMVDTEGNQLDRDLIIGHAHDEEGERSDGGEPSPAGKTQIEIELPDEPDALYDPDVGAAADESKEGA